MNSNSLTPADSEIGPSGRRIHGPTTPGAAAPCFRSTALTNTEVDEAVELIAAGRLERHSAVLPDRLRTRDWDSVMAVLLGLEGRLPAAPAGWKVGAASEQVRKLEGMPTPVPGRIYAATVFGSPARLSAELFINYRNCECEFAFRLGTDLPARHRPYSDAEVRAAIACMLPVIEIGDTVFDDWYGASAYFGPCLDNGGSAAVVHGAECADWARYDLSAARINVNLNGVPLKSGRGEAAMGHPVTSLAWIVNWLRERGRSLYAGELVSTGTCTGHCFAQEGDTVVADFGPFGVVEVTFGGLEGDAGTISRR